MALHLIRQMTTILLRLSLYLLAVMFSVISYAYALDQDVSHDLFIEASIPDLIELKGLPKRINVKWRDGKLTHQPVHFDINRSYASKDNPQPYSIRIKSSEGQSGNEFYLSHTQATDEKLFLNVQFKDREEDDFTRYFSADQALTGTTIKNIGSQSTGIRKTASLMIFNHDQDYLVERLPGQYSATFTVMVAAI